jgi:hypothetical protein
MTFPKNRVSGFGGKSHHFFGAKMSSKPNLVCCWYTAWYTVVTPLVYRRKPSFNRNDFETPQKSVLTRGMGGKTCPLAGLPDED